MEEVSVGENFHFIKKAASRIDACFRFYLVLLKNKQLNELEKFYEKESIKPIINNTNTFEDIIAVIDYLSKDYVRVKKL